MSLTRQWPSTLPADASPAVIVDFATTLVALAAETVDAAAGCLVGACEDERCDVARAQSLARTADRLSAEVQQLRTRGQHCGALALVPDRGPNGEVEPHLEIARWAAAVAEGAAVRAQSAESLLRQWARETLGAVAARQTLPDVDLAEARREHVAQFERPTAVDRYTVSDAPDEPVIADDAPMLVTSPDGLCARCAFPLELCSCEVPL